LLNDNIYVNTVKFIIGLNVTSMFRDMDKYPINDANKSQKL